MLKSYEEIVNKCKNPECYSGNDLMVYLEYIPFEYAKEFIYKDETEFSWNQRIKEPIEKNVLYDLKKYMDFAWRKVIDHNHEECLESIDHIIGWLWLLNDTELLKFVKNADNFSKYGIPILVEVCTKYNFPIPDGVLIQNMINGKPCCPTCSQGCL